MHDIVAENYREVREAELAGHVDKIKIKKRYTNMNIKKVKINSITSNVDNPRLIKDFKFGKLVDSIKQFPEMLKIRPIVVNKDNVILGGNMRYKASVQAGLKEVYIIQADELTEEQERVCNKGQCWIWRMGLGYTRK